MCEVVFGCFVNVYCYMDWILFFMWCFNMFDFMIRFAGLFIVKRVSSVENYNIKNFCYVYFFDEILCVFEEIDF